MKNQLKLRKLQPSVQISKEEFRKRIKKHFFDPAFKKVQKELNKVIDVAWDGYTKYRRAPVKVKAGTKFSKPGFELDVDWNNTRNILAAAESKQKSPKTQSRVLLINASPRSDQTCPGESSKTFRLSKIAEEIFKKDKVTVDFLDLSRLTAEYGKVIYPCKACVSTAMPLCHWPCSCYPNYAMHQTGDWMAEIYEKWVSAHGVMIVTPVHWYQSPTVLKLMIDRLVCADGGNPDPSTTKGKNPMLAKELELKGWDYPKHLAGRAFSVVVHGDAAGVENLRRILSDWLTDLELIQAGPDAVMDRYIGYYEPYATSHDDLDKDKAIHYQPFLKI